MGTTYRRLLAELLALRATPFPSDPERDAARLQAIEETLQTMLEMLSRQFDPPEFGQPPEGWRKYSTRPPEILVGTIEYNASGERIR